MSAPLPRHALVTGASSGLGRALSSRLARRRIHTVVAARREAELASLVEEIERAGGSAEALVLDVEDVDRTEAVVRERAQARAFDLVVANAGVSAPTPAWKPVWSDLRQVLTIDLIGAAATLYGALPAMLAQGHGHLVGVSSLAGLGRGLPATGAYCAAKTGFTVLLEGMRIDLADRGILVSTICPGFVRTAMTAKNKFPMPFMLELDRAADIMDGAIARGDRFCAFPLPLATVTRALPLLPDSVYEGLARMAGRRVQRGR